MTQDEQQQVNAAFRFFESQVGNVAREGANAMMAVESLAIRLKAAEAEIAKLKAPDGNVVPINKEPAA
jgi:hypothetical protein